jgi:hypothetical protein
MCYVFLCFIVTSIVAYLAREQISDSIAIALIIGAGASGALAAYVGSLWLYWSMFAPKRTTDVFYLRSFRNDSDTWFIRVSIQEALGPHLRLSGIRDPERRELSYADRWNPLFVVMKYCTPRFMDLEAGSDWKARLWHSLRSGQAAVLDLSTVTPFVAEEIRIATSALGLQRLIFLGHLPQTEEQIRSCVRSNLELATDDNFHVVLWQGTAAAAPPRPALRSFYASISQAMQTILTQARPAPSTHPEWCGDVNYLLPGRRASRRLLWNIIKLQVTLFVLQLCFFGCCVSVYSQEDELNPVLAISSGPFVAINAWLMLQNWLIYIRDVGVWRDRLKASIALVIFMMLVVLSLRLAF